MIYFAYIHSFITYEIIFWGRSLYAIKLFRIQKKVVRIIMGLKKSLRDSFKAMTILAMCSQYIYSLMQYVVNNIPVYKKY
jgi:uncharacterized protein YeeX (DUF496 family)